jgi:TRAP-type C4-dicarboxylate transport system substrate-binding protein
MVANTVKALGGAPVFMSGGEVYMALQRGTVDGLATGFTAFLERKFYEVNKYLLVAPQGYQTYTVMVSKSFWESLPPDQQKTIQDSVKRVADDVRKNVEKINEEAFQELVKKGVQPYTASKEELKEFLKATQSVRDEFFSKHGDQAKQIVNEILK